MAEGSSGAIGPTLPGGGGGGDCPIAIVGIGCRFPGRANDADSFWKLLVEGRSGVREVPADRWNLDRYYHPDPAVPGTMITRWGGFIDDLDKFDAHFWGVSPREAMRMDPQQRWLLEVAWEAIEDSGVAPRRLRGANIGVFVGISGNDYAAVQLPNLQAADAYTNSGCTLSIASNRISYLLDLRGPSVSVDTACSSSAVAVWMACESIRMGHCEAALAGGVNALITPHATVGFSKASMVSPSGQCFAFDARANGYVRGEGAGIVHLKPLAAALADGDRIYAVIRAAVVNQDGHTSSMSVPSVDAQAAMLRQAYRQAGVAPGRVVYVEAHGTGTPVGDPLEATALGRILAEGRSPGGTCLLGSVKTNIGHLEAGSGIAGLIKAALVLHRRTIPPSLNYEHPNPHIPFKELRLAVASRLQPLLPVDGQPPVVGLNSFGFGGTNAHLVLEAGPAPTPDDRPVGSRADRPCVLPVSARDETALRRYVESYRDFLAETPHTLAEVGAAAGERKEHHPYRLVAIAESLPEVRKRLATWLRDGIAPGIVSGRTANPTPLVFVFSGQGTQWWGMGQQLLQREPEVRRTIEEIDARFRSLAGWSLIAEMRRPAGDSRIDGTDVAQPAIFALQVGLAELWRSWGVRPAKAVGHSVGEVAAAYCAGAYSLEDAVKVIFHRSRLQHSTAGSGRMLAVALSPDDARQAIGGDSDRVELAGINSPHLVTLSGGAEPLERIAAELERRGVFTRWLRIQYAFHSRHMDPIRHELLRALADIEPRASGIPFVSTVTGTPLATDALTAEYWWENVRRPVLFGSAIAELVRLEDETFLELGPHPALESALRECLADQGRTGAVFHSLRREADESREMLTSLVGLHVLGVPIDWHAANQAGGPFVPFVRLPHYPWNRESFWLESRDSAQGRLAAPVHPLLGLRVPGPLPTWQFTLDLRRLPYLGDHRLWDRVVFPAAGYGEMGLALGRLLFPHQPHAVEDLEINKALFVNESEPSVVQVVFNPDDKSFGVYSSTDVSEVWELQARGKLTAMAPGDPAPLDLERTRAGLVDHFDHEECCHEFTIRGYQFGPMFQQLHQMWRRRGEALAEIEAPESVATAAGEYCFHPALQDACFQAFMGTRIAATGARPEDDLFLPQSVRRIHLYCEKPPARLWAHARLTAADGRSLVADIRVYSDQGRRVADILGFRLDHVEQKRPTDAEDAWYYRFEWEPRRLRGSGGDGTCSFASSAEIVAAARAALPAISSRHALDQYHRDYVPRARGVVCQLIQNAFAELGWNPAPGARVEFSSFVRALGIHGQHVRVTRSLLRDLERQGWLRPAGHETWEVVRASAPSDGAAELEALAAQYPQSAAEADLLQRMGPNLAAMLTGDADPMTSLFPGGSHEPLERYYAEALAFPAHLELLRASIARAIGALPPRRALRVLEVGAGTGSVARVLLPVFPASRTDYLFTDVGPAFLASAHRRFTEFPFVDYQVFDIEQEPERQGILLHGFDLILAADVVHATADLRQTLSRLRACLADGGLLMLLELVTRDSVREDIIFGLLKGWWRFTDTDLRPHSPLLEAKQWEALLAECGFRDVASVSCTPEGHDVEHAAIMGFAPVLAADRTSEAPSTPDTTGTKGYILFADHGGVAESLSQRLRQQGHRSVLVRRGDGFQQDDEASFRVSAESEEDIRRVLASNAVGSHELAGVIHCWSLDHPQADGLQIEHLRAAGQTGVMSAFRLARALPDGPTPVWFVTRNVHRVRDDDRVEGLASAPLVGLARVANNERRCGFYLVDLDACSSTEAAEHLMAEVTAPREGEFETAYRDSIRHALRLCRVRADQLPTRLFNAVRADGSLAPYRLQTDKPGVLTNLALHETNRPAPGSDELEIRVHAGGINFRDVLKALGTHPGNPRDVLWLGDDCSGVVERVGEHVHAFEPGDEVVGVAPYSFRSYAITDARMVFKKPPPMSFAQAATLPTVFLTAHYALHHLARMQPGERILIHAGAGGVGQAAIQVARHLGLEIFATAGTPEKRQLLLDLGVRHALNSRTLDFADQIIDITGGRGVDAVLNSLAGEFIPKSLSVLAPFGRFLEIGKVDVYRNSKIGLQQLRNNVSYFVIDLTQVLEKPVSVARIFAELGERFAAGEYQPLSYTSFPITQAADAFRFMAQGKHVGKNVLKFDVDPIPIALCTEDAHRFRAEATYLITGGARGFGLEVAKWMSRHGARHLALMTRTGPGDDAARRDIEELRAAGITVVDARGDVAEPDDVRRVVEQIRSECPPLKGVFHAAMVLDDEWLGELDEGRFRRVLEPKMAGAWNLDVATRDSDLEHFVCFSSFSAVCGAPRQSAYNAGNFFLDALAHYRHAEGRPALTVDWGVIVGAGYVERNQKTAEYLDKIGFKPFRVDEALRALGRLLPLDPVQIVAARVDWRSLSRLGPLIAASNTYGTVARENHTAEGQGSPVARLRGASASERVRLVEDFIVSQVAGVFGMADTMVDRTAPLTSLGLDSLMTVELVNRVDRGLGLRIPLGNLLSGPNVKELTQLALRLLAPALDAVDEAPDTATPPATPPALVAPQPPAPATVSPLSPSLSTRDGRHVVPIRAAGDQPPLIAFHPVGGGVGIYTPLARYLPGGVPLYGIESRLMRGAEQEFADMDEMVSAYVAAVREVGPPPYRVFGFSLGGYLAARVAEVLERDGETVEFVGVIEWDARPRITRDAQRHALLRLSVSTYRFLAGDMGAVRWLPESQLTGEMGRLVERVVSEGPGRSDVFFHWAVENGLIVSEALEGWARQYLAAFGQHCSMLARELPPPRFHSPLVVWRARDGFGSGVDSWEHAGPVAIEHVVDGDHFAFLRPPGVLALAEQIDGVLRHGSRVVAPTARAGDDGR